MTQEDTETVTASRDNAVVKSNQNTSACVANETIHTAISGLSALYGVHTALVIDNVDPDSMGRVKITLPWASGADDRVRYEAWARIATLMAGNNRGTWFVPEVDDEVLVAFEAGDPLRPYIVGALWNGVDQPPASMDDRGDNNEKTIRSRNGIKITLDDSSGQEQLICETPGGNKLTLKDGPGRIEVEDSNGNIVHMKASGIEIDATAKVTINGSNVEVNAGMVTVNAGMSKFNGVVQCDTLIANSVISASYTPGAGNIW